MPKGEYDTPGPFRIGKNKFGDHLIMWDGVTWHPALANLKARIRFGSGTDEMERKYLVGLLNKGTHFDDMLTALKDAYGLPDYAGIDETEGGEKELVVSCNIWRERWGEMIAKLEGEQQ